MSSTNPTAILTHRPTAVENLRMGKNTETKSTLRIFVLQKLWMKSRVTRFFSTNFKKLICLFWTRQSPVGQGLLILELSRSHTQRRTTFGRTPLDEWSACRRDYLTTHNTHNGQTSMSPVGFEPTVSAGERSQTDPLDLAATGTGFKSLHGRTKCNGVLLCLDVN